MSSSNAPPGPSPLTRQMELLDDAPWGDGRCPVVQEYRNKVILAPMVRGSLLPLRRLCLHYGADIVYTDEIIDRKVHGCVRLWNKALQTVDFWKGDRVFFRTQPQYEAGRVVFQIGTPDAVGALKAAREVARDVAAIDINMGCPKHFSVSSSHHKCRVTRVQVSGAMGSALLAKPDTACDILKTLVRNLDCPVTCKIRLLEKESDSIDLVKRLAATGISAIAVHCRRRTERDVDPARWPELPALKSVLSIPVIVNGDVLCHEDIARVKETTGADSVLIARGALHHPSIFRTEGQLPLDQEIVDFLKMSVSVDSHHKNQKYVVERMLKAAKRTLPIYPEFQKAVRSKTSRELCAVFGLAEWYEANKCGSLGGVHKEPLLAEFLAQAQLKKEEAGIDEKKRKRNADECTEKGVEGAAGETLEETYPKKCRECSQRTYLGDGFCQNRKCPLNQNKSKAINKAIE